MNNDILMIILSICSTIAVYALCNKIYKKSKSPILNPVLTTSCLLILILLVLKIPYKDYNKGGALIAEILGPLVVVLAIPLYKNKHELIKNFVPIMGGILAGVITSFATVWGLCKVLNIDNSVMISIFSKSVTTPIAVEITKMMGGIESITIIAVIITGIFGAGIAPVVLKYARIKNDIAKGIGIGAASHAVGTTKAIEMGETIGAASGLAMAVTGIVTILAVGIFG